jgi:hypothetical protein
MILVRKLEQDDGGEKEPRNFNPPTYLASRRN